MPASLNNPKEADWRVGPISVCIFFIYWGVYNVMHIQSSLKPMYTPAGEGYCPRTFQTAQDGTTLRFPLPK